MSGHSKWATIKRKKAATDAARGKLFTKLTNVITVAARSSGDPEKNPSLRLAIEKARAGDVPNANIEKAIKRGTGELDGVTLETFTYDAVGPEGLALIIEGVTDNKNRTLSDLRALLARHKGKLAESGSQRWQFDRRGVIEIPLDNITQSEQEKIELTAIEAGAEDVISTPAGLKVITLPKELNNVRQNILEAGEKIETANLSYIPKNTVEPSADSEKTIRNLLDELEEREDIQSVVTNLP